VEGDGEGKGDDDARLKSYQLVVFNINS
jgi:hypothetical protein